MDYIREGFEIASPVMKEVYREVFDYACHARPMLLFGPTGAGKEFVARYYYEVFRQNNPGNTPYKSLNCAGFSESLAISELFGHEKGSFTNAVKKKEGLFEEACKGVLFLDEIGDLPEPVQAMLLRAVDPGTHEARRLGSNRNYSTRDVIVICATEHGAGRLRPALLNRLGHQVFIPGVDKRPEDVPHAVYYFVKTALEKRRDKQALLDRLFPSTGDGKNIPIAGSDAADYLARRISTRLVPLIMGKTWPGNFREIRNAVDTAVIRARESGEIEKFVASAEHFYNKYLVSLKNIADYTGEQATLNREAAGVQAIMHTGIDEAMLNRIRGLLPGIPEEEKKVWAKFFTATGTRAFSRNELDGLFSIKVRTLQGRLEQLLEKGFLSRSGSRKASYSIKGEQGRAASVNPADRKEFHLPDISFVAREREKEVGEVIGLIKKTRGVFISGKRQSGKTTFLFLLGKTLLQQGIQVHYHAFDEKGLGGLLEIMARRLAGSTGFDPGIGKSGERKHLPLMAARLAGQLDNLFRQGGEQVFILDNADVIRSEEETEALNVMLGRWTCLTFVLAGKKLGNRLFMKENIPLAEYPVKPYKPEG